MAWNDENKNRLRELWAEGKSGAEIAAILGVSRNAVLGAVHRYKLNSSPFGERGNGRPRKLKKIAPPTPPRPPRFNGGPPLILDTRPLAPAVPPPPRGKPVSILQLMDEHCRTVLDVRDKRGLRMYCGRPRANERVAYCAECAERYGLFKRSA